nr:hypothetical protein CTI12_AA510230 [Tanacetum cinerariifolium]
MSHDSPKFRQFVKEQEVLAESWEQHLATERFSSRKQAGFQAFLSGLVDPRLFMYSVKVVESDDLLMATKPEVKYVPSDDDERESVNESETVEGPFEDPDISRLGRLNLGIPSPSVYLCLQRRHGICYLPDTDEQKIWLEFKKFDEGTMRSLEADHPIVSVVGNFAFAAFDYACWIFCETVYEANCLKHLQAKVCG